MTPLLSGNRIWIFFVIVAVGLALSWGQAGRKAMRELAREPHALLQTESPCAPLHLPCAAVGTDFGLVLGPGGQQALQLRAVGQGRPVLASAEIVAAGDAEPRWVLSVVPIAAATWRLPLPELPRRNGLALQVRFSEPAVSARFPLRQ